MDFRTEVKDLILGSNFVHDLLGEQPRSLSSLEGGHISVVYQALMANGASYVLKFAENAEELHHEFFFLTAWAAGGVRTPNVLRYQRLPDNLSGA